MANINSNTRRWIEEAPKPREHRDDRRSQEDRYWRQRDEEQKRQKEAERRAKEEAEKKALDIRSETAYPSLGGPRPRTTGLGKNSFAALSDENTKPKPSNTFATLAKTWRKEDEETRERERLRRLQSERDRFSSEGIFIYRPRQVQSGYGGYADPEDDEPRRTKPSDDEWQEISHKTYKPKREKTIEELDEEYQRDLDDEQNEGGHNEHLFEVSHRHDHY